MIPRRRDMGVWHGCILHQILISYFTAEVSTADQRWFQLSYKPTLETFVHLSPLRSQHSSSNMSDQPSTPAAENVAGASSNPATAGNGGNSGASSAAPKKPLPEQNPAFKMMGLPRFRLPSRNWLIFWSVIGSFAGAVVYDRWQTKRMREKWCNMVAHIAKEPLDTKTTPRKVTIYLEAPPGDGLRSAREHFHTYIKPVLVSAALDWDVVEGRKEGDVRHKTAERIRKRRKRNGEGAPAPEGEEEAYTVESIREKNGDVDYPGVAGDIVIGRHTWKEYIRGVHEGYLGPPDMPKHMEAWETPGWDMDRNASAQTPSHDDAGKAVSDSTAQTSTSTSTSEFAADAQPADGAPANADTNGVESLEKLTTETEETQETDEDKKKQEEAKKKEAEKPKRRFPPSYILPDEYETASLSPSTPEIIGPSVGVQLPHLLGFRNTPIRIYRFLTRRRTQDDIGRQVATAILASHRPYDTVAANDQNSASAAAREIHEQDQVLDHEERDWWKTVRQPRKEHEEDIWLQPMVLDERIASRMRAFRLTAEDEDRAKRIESGAEKVATDSEDSD
ncbi:Mitochondrial import inner membrane translocase subunit tim54 [Fulvia fulva]|nr:Mitochondrial import inner membrane translocase subunit tim54 [Fulvia fulva]WPV08366.1 Mitochondrial import inner membrane translocase subunit tim54 [Fulvia fulva]WPV24453.1 Mitochondrial import inner membrane translocase subunit tim54 [Fulvia fulva]